MISGLGGGDLVALLEPLGGADVLPGNGAAGNVLDRAHVSLPELALGREGEDDIRVVIEDRRRARVADRLRRAARLLLAPRIAGKVIDVDGLSRQLVPEER